MKIFTFFNIVYAFFILLPLAICFDKNSASENQVTLENSNGNLRIQRSFSKNDDESSLDAVDVMHRLLSFGISQIPAVGSVLNFVFDIFWESKFPNTKPDIFEEIKDKINNLVGDRIDLNTWNELTGITNELKRKIQRFNSSLESNDTNLIHEHYIPLSVFMTGMEENFKMPGLKLKSAFAPLYAAAVNLISVIRIASIKNAKKIGLTDSEIDSEIKELILLSSLSVQHMTDMQNDFKNYFEHTLKNIKVTKKFYTSLVQDTESIFKQNMMYQREAFSYIQIWKSYIDNPLESKNLFLQISYPALLIGQFWGYSNAFEIVYELMYNIQPTNPNINQVNLLDFKPDTPELARVCGVEYQVSDSCGKNYNHQYGYFGWPNDLLVRNQVVDISYSDPLAKAQILTTERDNFLNVIKLSTVSGNQTITAGLHDGTGRVYTLKTPSNSYIISSIMMPDEYQSWRFHSGHQATGVAFAVSYWNKNIKFKPVCNNENNRQKI